MEARHSHDTHIVEVSIEDHAGKPGQLVTRTCGDAPCGLSDGANGAKDAKERSAAMKKLWIAVVMCVVFMIVEVIGGIKANSLAIMTDAAHLLSDVAAFGISLFSLWAASWEATPRQSYGFFRIEILGTLVSIQLIWLLTGILVYEAINRMIYDSGEVQGFLMFAVAAFGLLVNLIMAFVLGHDHGHGHGGHSHDHGHGHGHGHGDAHGHGHTHSISMHHHSSQSKKEGKHHHGHHVGDEHGSKHHDHKAGHDHSEHDHDHDHHKHGVHSEHHHKHDALDNDPLKTPLITDESQKSAVKSEKKQRNINVQGAYLHVLGDSIQSIGVMIGGGVIWWKPQLQIIDLICTLFFSVIVLGTTVNMLRNILEVLMESTPREIDARRLEQGLCEMEDVEAIHELHIWAITVGKILLACHVKIKPDADADLVLDKVVSYIRTEYNISHVTIQIER